MRKILTLVLALMLVLTTLTVTSLAEEGKVYVDEDGTEYQVYDDVRLKMVCVWNGGYTTPDDQYGNEVATAIREKIGVTVEFEGIMMNEVEKLNLMFGSGDLPDIINCAYWGGTSGETGVIKKAGSEGRLIPVEDLVPKYANIADCWDVGQVSLQYLESDIDDPIYEGHRYIIPQEIDGDEADMQQWPYGVFVRKDVAETLGVDPLSIKTTEQLYDFMKAAQEYGFKDVNGNDCIVASTFHNGWNYADFQQNFNERKMTGYSLSEDGKVTYDALSEQWIEKQLFIWKLVSEGILDVECFETNDDLANEKHGNGTVLFSCAHYNCCNNATKQTGLYDAHPEMRYVPVGPLNFAGGEPGAQLESNGRSGSPVICFPINCQNVEAALTYINYVNGHEGYKLASYGFEGDTYYINEEGQPRMNDEYVQMVLAGENTHLLDRGIGYIMGRMWTTWKMKTDYGEKWPYGQAAPDVDVEYYNSIYPIEKIEGYPITALRGGFEGYSDFSASTLDSEIQKDYVRRAFFADTEDEARAILEDYQEFLRTNDGGMMQDFLDYLTDQLTTRDDIIF